MRVFVTGHNSYIGTVLTALPEADARIISQSDRDWLDYEVRAISQFEPSARRGLSV
jgi:hypothetical protein